MRAASDRETHPDETESRLKGRLSAGSMRLASSELGLGDVR